MIDILPLPRRVLFWDKIIVASDIFRCCYPFVFSNKVYVFVRNSDWKGSNMSLWSTNQPRVSTYCDFDWNYSESVPSGGEVFIWIVLPIWQGWTVCTIITPWFWRQSAVAVNIVCDQVLLIVCVYLGCVVGDLVSRSLLNMRCRSVWKETKRSFRSGIYYRFFYIPSMEKGDVDNLGFFSDSINPGSKTWTNGSVVNWLFLVGLR